MGQNLEQQRATYAWKQAREAQTLADYESYLNIVKGAGTFIMSNGLMPALAFYQSRTGSNKKAAEQVTKDILGWLGQANLLQGVAPSSFPAAMEKLLACDSAHYMRVTQETIWMLRWLRQFADALKNGQQVSSGVAR